MMPIPAILQCSLCQGVRRRAVTLSCCGEGSCRSCAVKHITQHRSCWSCGNNISTKDAINDQLLRTKIDELSDSSLLLCEVCKDICKRGVSSPCCHAQACRACAVKIVTGSRVCWGCEEVLAPAGIVNDELLRAAVDQFKDCGVMDPEHWDKLSVIPDMWKKNREVGEENEPQAVMQTKESNMLYSELKEKSAVGWFCPVENCHNKNMSSSLECYRCGSDRPIREKSTDRAGQVEARKNQTHVVQAEADSTDTMDEAPAKVYECPGVVLHLSDSLDCGVLELKCTDGKVLKCFFSGQDYLGRKLGNKPLSQMIHSHLNMKANARLVDRNSQIPYLASTVWPDGVEVGSEEMSKIFRPINQDVINKYHQLANDTYFLSSLVYPKHNSMQRLSPRRKSLEKPKYEAQDSSNEKKTPSFLDPLLPSKPITPSPPNLSQSSRALHLLQGSTPMPTMPAPPMITQHSMPPQYSMPAPQHTMPPQVSMPPPHSMPPTHSMPPQYAMPAPTMKPMSLSGAPVQAPTIVPNPPPTYLKECLGIVTNLINDNYGVAAVTLPGPVELGVSGPYLVLFDTCEFWAGANVVSDADIPLSEVTQVGDMVKMNAVKVDKVNARNIEYLATAVMTTADLDELMKSKFHESVSVIKDVHSVSEDKLTNFQVVVDFLNSQTIGPAEKEAVKKSTELAEQIFAKLQNPKNPSVTISGNVSSLPMPAIPSFPRPFLTVPPMQIPPPMFPPPMMPHMPPMMIPFPSQTQGIPPWIPPRIPIPSSTLVPSAPARVKTTMLPEKVSYWNDNLISNIDPIGEYIDCVYCRETVAIKPEDKFATFYLTHYASESHNMMVKAETVDQIVIRNYLSSRVMMNMQIRKEEGVGKAVLVHKSENVMFYMCKHWQCDNMVVSAWHFQNMKNSPKHNSNLPPTYAGWNAQTGRFENRTNLSNTGRCVSNLISINTSQVDDKIDQEEQSRLAKLAQEEKNRLAQQSGKACKDTRIRLCMAGYLVKKLNEVIFDCVVCKTTIFDGKYSPHALTAEHKDRDKQFKNLSNTEKIALYTEKIIMAKSRATLAIVQKTAKITCKFSEDYTYECFLCNQQNVSVFHFVDTCLEAPPWSGQTAGSLGLQSVQDLNSVDIRNSRREQSPIERGKRSRSPRNSRESSASPNRSRRDWEYKKSSSSPTRSLYRRQNSPGRKRSSPKRSRISPSRSRWSNKSPERSRNSPSKSVDAELHQTVAIKKEKK